MVLRSLLLCLFFCLAEFLISQRHFHNVPEAMVTVELAQDGSLITLSQSGKLYSFDGAEFRILQNGLKGAKSILKNQGNYYLPSNNGIYEWSAGKLDHQILNEECYSHIIAHGKAYAITQMGMYLFKEGRYQLINDWTFPILPTAKFHNVEDHYYLSNGNTIYIHKSGQWKVVARDSSLVNDVINYRDRIYAATDSGLRIMKNKILDHFMIDGLDDNLNVNQLFAFDEDLFVQSEGELFKWNPSNHQISKIDFKSSPSNLIQDHWGDIWFADEGNIIQHKVSNANLGEPRITDIIISVNGIEQVNQEVIIDEEGSDIKINYGAIHLRQPKNIKFQSLLSPLDKEYQSETSDRSIVFTDLPAGNYTYRLRSTVDGYQYSYSDPMKIEIKTKNEVSPLWWVLGASCLLLLFLALLSNYRLQGYKEKSSLLTAKLRTANDLLKSQQKTMQLQMNPHFLFNALNSIQGLVSLNRNDEAKKYIRTFSRMMRSILDFSTVERIDLQTEINYLEDYLSIEQMTRSNSFEYKLNVDESLIDDDVKIPPMILQPFVENAIIHGVSSIKQGLIIIDIKDKESYLKCTISDNGIGREAASQKKKSSHKSLAVSLASERLQKLSKAYDQKMIHYKDLSPGTEVDIRIPV